MTARPPIKHDPDALKSRLTRQYRAQVSTVSSEFVQAPFASAVNTPDGFWICSLTGHEDNLFHLDGSLAPEQVRDALVEEVVGKKTIEILELTHP